MLWFLNGCVVVFIFSPERNLKNKNLQDAGQRGG
jgi:hypothetical protein